MFLSTRYALSHRAIRALSVAIATTCIGLDSASMLLPIAGLASASALASSTSQAPLRNLLPFAEHQGEDRGSSLPGFSWLQNKATRMLIATHSANRAKKGVQSVSIRTQNSGDKTLIVLGEVRGQVAAVCWPSYAGWRFGLGAGGWETRQDCLGCVASEVRVLFSYSALVFQSSMRRRMGPAARSWSAMRRMAV